jgi:hypothetical protein
MFVLVAHGSSTGASGGTPSVRLSDAWCPAQRVARCLREKDQPILGIWICCDQTRTPHGGGLSAALASIGAGVSEVVAMQGNVSQAVAERFTRTFLEHLLAGMSTAMAARLGRMEVANHAHAFLPTVFRSAAWSGGSVVSRKAATYRAAVLGLRGQFPRPVMHLTRRVIEKDLRALFAGNGLLVVTGGPEVGKSQLIAAVARRMLATKGVLPRPVILIDVRQLPAASRNLAGIVQQLRRRLEDYNELLPEDLAGDSETSAPVRILSYVNDSGIVVVLDHFPDPSPDGEEPPWQSFVAAAKGLDRSLLVTVVTEGRLANVPNTIELLVPSFSPEETRDYVERHMPALTPEWTEVHQRTGGRPALLDMVRRRIEEGCPANQLREMLDPERRKLADFMLGGLSPADMAALHCLCRLRDPAASRRLATDFLIPLGGPDDAPWVPRDSVARLMRLGVLTEWSDRGEKLIRMPDLHREAAMLLAPPAEALAENVCKHFFRKLGKDHAATIRRVYDEPGGPAVLSAAQSAFIEFAEQSSAAGNANESTAAWKLALSIATAADSGGAVTWDLLELYKPLTADKTPAALRARAMLRGATVARSIGEDRVAAAWLGSLASTEMPDARRAEFLFTRARFLKDVKQHAAVPQIHADLSEGLAAAERASRGTGEDTGALRIELLQARIDTRMFLEGATPADVADDYAWLEALHPTLEQIGNALATFAERAQKGRSGGLAVDWDVVADYALRAYRLAERSQDHRFRGFAAYRYARYLEEGPKQYVDAARIYAEAEDEGRLAGEPRRQANAGFRRLRLQWSVLKIWSGRDASDPVDQLVRLALRQPHHDSLTLRVAQRLLLLRAEMAERDGTGPFLGLLKSACRTGAQLPPGSRSDDHRLGESLRRYLKWLHAIGGFAEGQLIVHELEIPLRERLGIDVTGHDPWSVEAQLAARYNDAQG